MSILDDLRAYLFNNKRKKKVIDINMQAQLAVEILLHVVIFFTLVILVMYVDPFVTLFSNQPAAVHQNALEWLISLNLRKWPLFIGIGLVIVIVSVLMSHRIAGPFYKIRMMLDKYAARDLKDEMYLRKHDYFLSAVPSINNFRLTVSNDLRELGRDLEKIKETAESLPAEARQKILDAANPAAERIRQYSLSDAE